MSMRLTHTLALFALLCGLLVAEPVAARVASGILNAKRLQVPSSLFPRGVTQVLYIWIVSRHQIA